MDKSIKDHEIFVNKQINKIKAELQQPHSEANEVVIKQKIRDLNEYHNSKIHDFQHERHIHLIVTLFFALLMLLSVGLIIILSSANANDTNYVMLNTMALIIFAVIFTTEIFYIFYYFKLENGTQKLYKLSKILYVLIDN